LMGVVVFAAARRPQPTPCRSRNAGHETGVAASFGVSDTGTARRTSTGGETFDPPIPRERSDTTALTVGVAGDGRRRRAPSGGRSSGSCTSAPGVAWRGRESSG
jgi:hypothetical protein